EKRLDGDLHRICGRMRRLRRFTAAHTIITFAVWRPWRVRRTPLEQIQGGVRTAVVLLICFCVEIHPGTPHGDLLERNARARNIYRMLWVAGGLFNLAAKFAGAGDL